MYFPPIILYHGRNDCHWVQTWDTDKLLFRQQQCGEPAAIHRTGVDSDFIRGNIWFVKCGMAKDNRFTEITARLQKCLPSPEAPLLRLLAEMPTGLEPGMDVHCVCILPEQWQTIEKHPMCRRHQPLSVRPRRGWREAVAGQCLPAAGIKEEGAFLPGQELKKKKVVIPHKCNHAAMCTLQGEDRVHHFLGVRPPVYIITQENNRVGHGQNLVQERDKRSVAAVNITDDTGCGTRCLHTLHHHFSFCDH